MIKSNNKLRILEEKNPCMFCVWSLFMAIVCWIPELNVGISLSVVIDVFRFFHSR